MQLCGFSTAVSIQDFNQSKSSAPPPPLLPFPACTRVHTPKNKGAQTEVSKNNVPYRFNSGCKYLIPLKVGEE